MKKEKGFTLIELLVVVSVIAILASVVLVNLRGARERAMDTRVISSLGQVRAVAEIIQSRTGGYVGLCGTTTTLGTIEGLPALATDIEANNNPVTVGVGIACHVDAANYCVSSLLNETPTAHWCINSAGRSVRIVVTSSPCTVPTSPCI